MNTAPNYIDSICRKKNINIIASLTFIFFGLLTVYIPTFVDLFRGLWSDDRHAHGPIVFAISLWFFYYKTQQLLKSNIIIAPSPYFGWSIFILGLCIYIVGRSQTLYILEVSALIILLIGIVSILWGRSVAKHFWFAFFFMLFMVPLPSSVVDSLTQPMKIAVSFAAEYVLYHFDYPVAREGVILSIGQYQLLVADACAGLNSLFTLEALGLLYMNVIRHESVVRNVVLATLIVPISFVSNVTRVVLLSLITYYWGDMVGQGFLHEFSGMVLFITALLLIIFVDTTLRAITLYWSAKHAK